MSKKLWSPIPTTVFLLGFIASCLPKALAQELPFSQLTLEIDTTKQSFIKLEPIPVILRLSNKTDKSILGHTTLDFSANFVELFTFYNGKMQKIINISPIRESIVVYQRRIEPGEHHLSKQLLTLDLDKIFSQAGTYQIEAVLHDIKWKEEIRSNRLTIQILEPTGVDLKAFEFLKANANLSHLFSGLGLSDERAQNVLKAFVSDFRDSSYGDYAAYRLGRLYFVRKEYKEAVKHLDTVGRKPDFVLADVALYFLVEAQVRLGNLQQASYHLDTLRALHPESEFVERAELFMSEGGGSPSRGK